MLYYDTLQTLSAYLEKYPEDPSARVLFDLAQSDEMLTKRTRSAGHITASGLVLHEGKLLLIFHNKLQKHLQPGGHLEEGDETLLGAAQREVLEETGLHTEPYNGDILPMHIDIHAIPYNEKKNEPEHLHYDIRFLLTPTHTKVVLQESEVSGFEWVSLGYNFQNDGLAEAAKKIKLILTNT